MKKIIILLVTFTFVLTLSSCKNKEEEFVFDVPSEYAVNKQNLSYAEYLSLNNPLVTITVKDIGDIQLQLFPSVAPNTVNSFIQHIEDGDYTNNEFHRVIDSVLIQGGHLDDPGCMIPLEADGNDLLHKPGVISMARPNSSDTKDNATSEFFILMTVNSDLDGSYTPFGGVVSGFHILEYIASLEDGDTEAPVTTITISSITVDLRGYTPTDRVCTVE